MLCQIFFLGTNGNIREILTTTGKNKREIAVGDDLSKYMQQHDQSNYAIGWLLPSVMISVAIGMFFTELTGTPIAVIVQGVWWFIDINMGINKLEGAHTLFELTPRHNALGKMQTFLNELTTLAVNRLFIAGVALLLVIAIALIYSPKRRGELAMSLS